VVPRHSPPIPGQRRPELPWPQRPRDSHISDTLSPAPLPFVPVGLAPESAALEPTGGYSTTSANIDAPGTKFIYPKLPDGNIRLLHLLPDRERNVPLKCQLIDYPIQSMGNSASLYEALSYC